VPSPQLTDSTKQVSKEYGVLLDRLGAALRAMFLIGPEGLVRTCRTTGFDSTQRLLPSFWKASPGGISQLS